jgi:multidrug efflux pump subunit AcrA (membrane-fusion protein)
MSARDAYLAKIQAEIELAQAKLAELKAQAKISASDVRIKYSQMVDDLERKLDATKTKLKELGAASEGAWEHLQDGIQDAWTDLESGIGKVAAKFKS